MLRLCIGWLVVDVGGHGLMVERGASNGKEADVRVTKGRRQVPTSSRYRIGTPRNDRALGVPLLTACLRRANITNADIVFRNEIKAG